MALTFDSICDAVGESGIHTISARRGIGGWTRVNKSHFEEEGDRQGAS